MIEKFWDKVGENLAGEWSFRMLFMAFAFWGIGFITYALKYGWDKVESIFTSTGGNPVMGGTIIVVSIAIVAASNAIMVWISFPILKLIEGYWPEKIREWAATKEIRRRRGKKSELNNLIEKKEKQQLDLSDERKFAHLEYTLQYFFPFDDGLILPTSIGNILKAAEEYPFRVYGLEVGITLPHIWLAMPDYSRKQLIGARQNLDTSVQLISWSLLLLVWTYFQWWVPFIALLSAAIAWSRVKESAFSYAQLLRAIYDLHRFDLYKCLHWELPKLSETKDEVNQGKLLTTFLFRHQVNQPFIHPKNNE